ncbi:hypothetical protein K435DRAFT_296155 [Dendrothele bispora CBS 962.96]|uniref:Uncharacterized protein n=1 Tax=Dendrothele bispora (strain CBS 962.96) TaxID=1314807 RepID=A0A4S8LKJ8_DENBC|nr:hypothetical protein K435DRAFT_296155 [Dendrothele bispora CBS 962.96]
MFILRPSPRYVLNSFHFAPSLGCKTHLCIKGLSQKSVNETDLSSLGSTQMVCYLYGQTLRTLLIMELSCSCSLLPFLLSPSLLLPPLRWTRILIQTYCILQNCCMLLLLYC